MPISFTFWKLAKSRSLATLSMAKRRDVFASTSRLKCLLSLNIVIKLDYEQFQVQYFRLSFGRLIQMAFSNYIDYNKRSSIFLNVLLLAKSREM